MAIKTSEANSEIDRIITISRLVNRKSSDMTPSTDRPSLVCIFIDIWLQIQVFANIEQRQHLASDEGPQDSRQRPVTSWELFRDI